jgi:hypothetical protein
MRGTLCLDCQVDTLPVTTERAEWYVVTDEVWEAAGMARFDGCLCIGCLEGRLGRELTADDFSDAPLNDLSRTDMPRYAFSYRTPRLVDRLTRAKADTGSA